MTEKRQRYFYKSTDGKVYEVTKPRKCHSFPLTFRLATRLADEATVYFVVTDLITEGED